MAPYTLVEAIMELALSSNDLTHVRAAAHTAVESTCQAEWLISAATEEDLHDQAEDMVEDYLATKVSGKNQVSIGQKLFGEPSENGLSWPQQKHEIIKLMSPIWVERTKIKRQGLINADTVSRSIAHGDRNSEAEILPNTSASGLTRNDHLGQDSRQVRSRLNSSPALRTGQNEDAQGRFLILGKTFTAATLVKVILMIFETFENARRRIRDPKELTVVETCEGNVHAILNGSVEGATDIERAQLDRWKSQNE